MEFQGHFPKETLSLLSALTQHQGHFPWGQENDLKNATIYKGRLPCFWGWFYSRDTFCPPAAWMPR